MESIQDKLTDHKQTNPRNKARRIPIPSKQNLGPYKQLPKFENRSIKKQSKTLEETIEIWKSEGESAENKGEKKIINCI